MGDDRHASDFNAAHAVADVSSAATTGASVMPQLHIAAMTLTLAGAGLALQAPGPAPATDPNRKMLEIADFRLEGGGVLPKARVAYATFGTLNAARDNAVLLTTSSRRRLPRLRLRGRCRQGLRSGAALHRHDRDVRQRRLVLAQQHAGPACRPGFSGDRHPRQRRGVAARARAPGRGARARCRRVLDGRRAVVPVGGITPRLHGRDRPVVRHSEDLSARRRQARERDRRADHRPGIHGGRSTARHRPRGWRRGRRTGRPGSGPRNGGGASCTNPRAPRWRRSSPHASPAMQDATPTT